MSAVLHVTPKDASAAPEGRLVPFSCSTNVSNDVLDNLRRAKLGGAAMAFCLYMHRRTETACAFDLELWAAEIPNDKSNVRRIRANLVACGIVTFTEDAETPGHGVSTWNLAFDEWQRQDHRGRPKQSGVVISTAETVIVTTFDCSNITTPARQKDLIITTLDSLESGPEAVHSLVNKGIQKEREILANASSVAEAGAPPADASPTPPSKPKAAKPLTPKQEYQIALLAAVQEIYGAPLPDKRREWGSAGQLFAKGFALETAIACYRAEATRPKWDTEYCSLGALHRVIGAYEKAPANFLAGIERSRAAAKGEYARAASASRPQRSSLPTASHAPTDPFA